MLPSHAQQKLRKARQFLLARNFAQALPGYQKLSRLCSGDAVIWFEYGSVAAGLRNRELADRAWHKASELAPRNAGLLTQIGSAPYSVTKHAAMSFAEWLSITYFDQGLRVSALCPQGVKTEMLRKAEFGGGAFLLEGALEPEQVAAEVIKAVIEERFLVLPHPEVVKYFQNKANDYDRWLRGMRKLQAKTMPLTAQV